MTLHYYTGLLNDPQRLRAFREAIKATVRPGDRVLEIGTGIGTYAFMAAEAGASEVWAIEMGPAIHLAETMAVRNGLEDRITFVRGSYPEVNPEGRFDVIIFEDFVVGLLSPRVYEVLEIAVTRDLASGGTLLPNGAQLHMAPVRAGDYQNRMFEIPDSDVVKSLSLDPVLLTDMLSNTVVRLPVQAESLLGLPADGPILSLLPPPAGHELGLRGAWLADATGEVGAIALWFTLRLGGDFTISNHPGPDSGPWHQSLLPVSPPVHLEKGERLEVEVRRNATSEGRPTWLEWRVWTAQEKRSGHQFGGQLLGPDDFD